MCAAGMNPERPKWTNPAKPTRDELASAAGGYGSYCGTYEVDVQRKQVVHHVQVDLDPNEVGVDLVRTYVFEGTRLKLTGTEGLEPGFTSWTYTLERVKP